MSRAAARSFGACAAAGTCELPGRLELRWLLYQHLRAARPPGAALVAPPALAGCPAAWSCAGCSTGTCELPGRLELRWLLYPHLRAARPLGAALVVLPAPASCPVAWSCPDVAAPPAVDPQLAGTIPRERVSAHRCLRDRSHIDPAAPPAVDPQLAGTSHRERVSAHRCMRLTVPSGAAAPSTSTVSTSRCRRACTCLRSPRKPSHAQRERSAVRQVPALGP